MGLTRKSETGVFAIPDQMRDRASPHLPSPRLTHRKPPLKPKQTHPSHHKHRHPTSYTEYPPRPLAS